MRKIKVIGNTLIIVGILLLVSALIIDSIAPLLSITGLIVACLGLLYFLFYWRCPHCHKHLPFNGMLGMEHCPYCGNQLNT